MINRQLEHTEVKTRKRKFPLKVICDNIESPENVGMIFRNCEAMGVEEIILCGTSITPPNRKIRKVSRSTDKYVPYRYVENISEVIDQVRSGGCKVLALEVTDKSISLSRYSFTPDKPYAIIVGSEKFGVSEQALSQTDEAVEITMFGTNTSINVVSALSMLLFEVSRQLAP